MNTPTATRVNGVNVEALTNTVNAIVADPPIAAFQFRARNQLIEGGLNRSTIQKFHGAKQEMEHGPNATGFVLENDEPPVLLGGDRAPNPGEYLLHALLGCLTTTTVYKAAAMGIAIDSIRSEVEGDVDLQGMLELDAGVRPGFQEFRAKLFIKSSGSREKLTALHRSSPVLDTLARPVPVKVEVIFE